MSINSNIIVGVSAGIAAYKAPILVRRLKDQGADVRVVMTKGAKHFITALTLQAVSGHPVRETLLDAEAESGMDHIDLARWADKIIIAPATADFIARLAHGIADDLLSTLCLATEAPLYLAPAMNQQMWQNCATQDNLIIVKNRGISILGPESGDQACGETGPGRMMEPTAIIESVFFLPAHESNTSPVETGLKTKPNILITAGPTWEALDPVRGLTNHSSGKMGYNIASAFSAAGYNVKLISGPTSLTKPSGVDFTAVISAQDMYEAVHENIHVADIFISVAAVADYRPDLSFEEKIKKSNDEMQIKLIRNPDILKSVTELKAAPFSVGFAAETNNVIDFAKKKLKGKNLDIILANEVGKDKGFGQDDNQLTVLSKTNSSSKVNAQPLGPDSKSNLARQLVSIIIEQYEEKNSTKDS